MKAKKALKHLTRIETLLSDVAKRFSAGAPHLREVLQAAKAAVARAKEVVSLRTSSPTAKKAPGKHSKPPSKAAPAKSKRKRRATAKKAARLAKKAAPARKKAAVRKAAARNPTAKRAKKRAPIKKTVRKKAAKQTAPAPVQVVADAAAPEPMAPPPGFTD
jgi:hypothetical protein